MKKRTRIGMITLSVLVTAGVWTYNDFGSTAKATSDVGMKETNSVVPVEKMNDESKPKVASNVSVKENNEIKLPDRSNENLVVPVEKDTDPQTKRSETVPGNEKVIRSKPAKVEKEEIKQAEKETASINPETRVIGGSTYINITDSKEENITHLVQIAKKHNAALYAIEYSDSFAMFSNTTGEMLIMFSTGIRSVPVEHAAILYDMHPEIKDQIKDVVETGKETTIELGEFQSYHISNKNGKIYLSF
ncbi:hypothetical protein [Fictibacillus phosphorivorans]|uniref:hypothetical protein n=1 Tax=Fictibacillus phosphorivorans TaxID=1221500 RepID=UPI00203DDE5C|nr:hypothetical protein [Fictibacillus phosphorivorans]MCM3718711.1 hypothetical protein [Fictibacillus phosphorivorans]MCM3776334.1 hypothetical protein [Fictibacillus phosphorivorans]